MMLGREFVEQEERQQRMAEELRIAQEQRDLQVSGLVILLPGGQRIRRERDRASLTMETELGDAEHRAQSVAECGCWCLGLALPKSSRGVRSTGKS